MRRKILGLFHVAAAGLGIGCAGCSFAFSRGPEAKTGDASASVASAKCSAGVLAPVLDTGFAAADLSGMIWSYTQSDSAFGNDGNFRAATIGANFVAASVLAASALYGYKQWDSCRKTNTPSAEIAHFDRSTATLVSEVPEVRR